MMRMHRRNTSCIPSGFSTHSSCTDINKLFPIVYMRNVAECMKYVGIVRWYMYNSHTLHLFIGCIYDVIK